MKGKKFLGRFEVCILCFHFLLQSTFISIIFCYDQIFVSLVSMWSQSGKVDSSTASFAKSGPCLNTVAVVVTVEDLSRELPLAALSSLLQREKV